jgi:serine protease Do
MRAGRVALGLVLGAVVCLLGRAAADSLPAMGWLGVQITEVTEDTADTLATTFGYAAGTGVQVVDVLPGGPAEQAKLQRGDVIVALDAQPIWDVRQLQHLIQAESADRHVQLTVLRATARMRLPVTIGAMPLSTRAQLAGERFGFVVREVRESESNAGARSESEARRVVVAYVDPDSPAAEADIRPLDVITRANELPVHTLEDFASALALPGERLSLVLERRDGAPLSVTLDRAR